MCTDYFKVALMKIDKSDGPTIEVPIFVRKGDKAIFNQSVAAQISGNTIVGQAEESEERA